MDTWQEEQIKRMQVSTLCSNPKIERNKPDKQLGGNKLFREFMRSYRPVDQGGYNDGLSPHETYHCWAATQYRQKVCYLYVYGFLARI